MNDIGSPHSLCRNPAQSDGCQDVTVFTLHLSSMYDTFQFQAFWTSIYAYKHTCCHSNPLSTILDYIHYPLVFYCTYTFTSPIYPHVHFLHYMNYIITVHYIQIRKHIPPNNPSILHYMEYSTFHEDLFFHGDSTAFSTFPGGAAQARSRTFGGASS